MNDGNARIAVIPERRGEPGKTTLCGHSIPIGGLRMRLLQSQQLTSDEALVQIAEAA